MPIDATTVFCGTTRPKDGDTLTGTEVDGMTTIFIYLVVPFWQWRKLSRAVQLADEALGGM